MAPGPEVPGSTITDHQVTDPRPLPAHHPTHQGWEVDQGEVARPLGSGAILGDTLGPGSLQAQVQGFRLVDSRLITSQFRFTPRLVLHLHYSTQSLIKT